jgi:hypothetical protein
MSLETTNFDHIHRKGQIHRCARVKSVKAVHGKEEREREGKDPTMSHDLFSSLLFLTHGAYSKPSTSTSVLRAAFVHFVVRWKCILCDYWLSFVNTPHFLPEQEFHILSDIFANTYQRVISREREEERKKSCPSDRTTDRAVNGQAQQSQAGRATDRAATCEHLKHPNPRVLSDNRNTAKSHLPHRACQAGLTTHRRRAMKFMSPRP